MTRARELSSISLSSRPSFGCFQAGVGALRDRACGLLGQLKADQSNERGFLFQKGKEE